MHAPPFMRCYGSEYHFYLLSISPPGYIDLCLSREFWILKDFVAPNSCLSTSMGATAEVRVPRHVESFEKVRMLSRRINLKRWAREWVVAPTFCQGCQRIYILQRRIFMKLQIRFRPRKIQETVDHVVRRDNHPPSEKLMSLPTYLYRYSLGEESKWIPKKLSCMFNNPPLNRNSLKFGNIPTCDKLRRTANSR